MLQPAEAGGGGGGGGGGGAEQSWLLSAQPAWQELGRSAVVPG